LHVIFSATSNKLLARKDWSEINYGGTNYCPQEGQVGSLKKKKMYMYTFNVKNIYLNILAVNPGGFTTVFK